MRYTLNISLFIQSVEEEGTDKFLCVMPDSHSSSFSLLQIKSSSGHIISRKMRLRRSSKLMHYDPLTLVIAPTQEGFAQGTLYMDDEATLAHQTKGAYVYRKFTFQDNVLTCASAVLTPAAVRAQYRPPNTVERVEIANQKSPPKRVVYRSTSASNTQPGVEIMTYFNAERGVLILKKPDGNVGDDWAITLEY